MTKGEKSLQRPGDFYFFGLKECVWNGKIILFGNLFLCHAGQFQRLAAVNKNCPAESVISPIEMKGSVCMAVSEELKKIIEATIEETLKNADAISREREKAAREKIFRDTEKLLYSFTALKEHIANEEEYLNMINKRKSGSVVRYTKNGHEAQDIQQIINSRIESYNRSRDDVERIENALNRLRERPGYEVIEMRYLQRKENKGDGEEAEGAYTFGEIADMLRGQRGYSRNLNEKTVRGYRNTLVHDIAVLLFGSVAI